MGIKGIFALILVFIAVSFSAKGEAQEESINQALDAFSAHYAQQLGAPQRCLQQTPNQLRVCSANLRNEGNAPFIMHHGKPTAAVVVLFHGLGDSPFYLQSVAARLHSDGHTVVVGLLPGHGLRRADADMQDARLAERWTREFASIVQLTQSMGAHLIVGGFSTGATLATQYALANQSKVTALLLLSGALALSDNAEQMSRIWGMQLLAKWLDGDFQTTGLNPYKYPKISLFAALELMEVIRQTREQQQQGVNVPIFAAHSLSDVTTPYHGVESLLAANKASDTTFLIDESYQVCHGNLTLDKAQVLEIGFDSALLEVIELCVEPEANPLHQQMLMMMADFVQQQLAAKAG